MTPENYKHRRSAIKDAIRYHKQRLAAMDIALIKLNEEAREQIEKKQEPTQVAGWIKFPNEVLQLTNGASD